MKRFFVSFVGILPALFFNAGYASSIQMITCRIDPSNPHVSEVCNNFLDSKLPAPNTHNVSNRYANELLGVKTISTAQGHFRVYTILEQSHSDKTTPSHQEYSHAR